MINPWIFMEYKIIISAFSTRYLGISIMAKKFSFSLIKLELWEQQVVSPSSVQLETWPCRCLTQRKLLKNNSFQFLVAKNKYIFAYTHCTLQVWDSIMEETFLIATIWWNKVGYFKKRRNRFGYFRSERCITMEWLKPQRKIVKTETDIVQLQSHHIRNLMLIELS